MTTSIEHDTTQHISETTQAIEVRGLAITSASGSTIAWESSSDVSVALHHASTGVGVHLPHLAEGGIVVVGLDPADDEFTTHEVVTQRTSRREDVEVIERAIAVLQQLRAGLIAAQGGAR